QEAQTMLIQPDNKILVAGYYDEMFEPYNVSIVRFNANGTIDSGFGRNGKILSTAGMQARAIALQPDGKILIEGDGNKYNALTLRYLSDGTPDVTFGQNGAVSTDFGGSNSGGNTIAVQPDGKIVTAGQALHALFFGRYNTNGSLDQSFGTNGKALYSFSTGVNIVQHLVLQPDGKIVAVGTAASYLPDTLNGIVLRCLPDGSLDESFGNAGLIIRQSADLRSVVLQKDAKIVTCGSIGLTANSGGFLLERYATDGSLDSTFGNNGYTTTTFDSINAAYSVFLQNDDKIILGGITQPTIIKKPSDIAIALARYDNDGLSQKQILISKIRRWLQHHNGIIWDGNNGISNYVVQRSYDGIHFNSITRITAVNTSNYTYEDPAPLSNTNYYRLQTTSVNGAVNYSNAIAITNDDIKVSPNPATNILQIQGLPLAGIKITVADFAGNIAISQQLKANSSSSYNLNIALLKQGNYLLKIETNDEIITRQFVKE
ncbi:MAG TPA: T9SS type A sorting domain-containing protein, partial [Parafilimonas sp.]